MHSPLSPASRRVSSKEPSCQVHSTGAAQQRNDGTSRHGERPCHVLFSFEETEGKNMQECGSLDARHEVVNDLLRVNWKKYQRSKSFLAHLPGFCYKIRESPLSSS